MAPHREITGYAVYLTDGLREVIVKVYWRDFGAMAC
jgi:hypothetical protein